MHRSASQAPSVCGPFTSSRPRCPRVRSGRIQRRVSVVVVTRASCLVVGFGLCLAGRSERRRCAYVFESLQNWILIFKRDGIWELGSALMQFALVLSLTVANKKCWPKSVSRRIIDLLIADNQVPAHAETTFVFCCSTRIRAASSSL